MRRTMKAIVVCMCACLILASCKLETSPVEKSAAPSSKAAQVETVPTVKMEPAQTMPSVPKIAVKSLVILDCALGEKPNTLGGDLGAWDKDPADTTQTCEMRFEAGDDALGDQNGYSLRLTYDVDSPNPAYNGFWTKLEGEDFSEYSVLNLYVKGDAAEGYTKKIKLEIKDFQNRVARYLLNGITDEWQKFSIPFAKIPGMSRLDLTSMNEFVIVFDDMNSVPKTGSILVDQVYVSNE
ncbi:MAG: hypothetical protein JW938_06180 [Candidatus Omnitrophica bacterium]|nr:hypothetical protein [Candidatus Omnitrophota bacterium]